MKMIMIVYNEAMDMEVMELLEGCVMKSYTKILSVQGKGEASGTHLGTEIWPGLNNILYVACEKEDADLLVGCVTNLRKKLGREGVKAFVWDLDRVA